MPFLDDIDNAIIFDAVGDDVIVNFYDGSLSGTNVDGIFSEPYESVNQFDGSVESTGPSVRVADTDIVDINIEHGQPLRVSGQDYILVGIQPDGEGWTVLYLRSRFD